MPAPLERNLVLWLTNVSHAVNHFQNQMVLVMYPVIMAELGFGPAQLGVLNAIRAVLGNASQGFYGFATPFVRRAHLMGLGNIVLSIGTLLTGFVNSFGTLVGARAVAAAGGSAQHPVGMSLLAGYYPKSRGTIMAFNNSVAGIGSLLAPVSAGLLLQVMSWRHVFFIVAFMSLAMGIAYLMFRNRYGATVGKAESGRAKLASGLASYRRVLRNRNMLLISLVLMVGAGGRGEGVSIYLGPHLVSDFGMSIALVGAALSAQQGGGIAGPVFFGWLSDRLSRKWVIQATLLLSALASWWVASQGAHLPTLFLSLVAYGMVTHSRLTLTQALVADTLSERDRDAAFSLFFLIGFISAPVWSLVTGYLMQELGFKIAFSTLAFSYLAGVLLMFLVAEPKRPSSSPAAA